MTLPNHRESMSKNNYYTIHCSSNTGSFTNVYHTLEEAFRYLKDRENADNLSGTEITVSQQYGWDDQERKELKRLKEKYEPAK